VLLYLVLARLVQVRVQVLFAEVVDMVGRQEVWERSHIALVVERGIEGILVG
jgi:hypothetical protein